jgi:hypothetical protein
MLRMPKYDTNPHDLDFLYTLRDPDLLQFSGHVHPLHQPFAHGISAAIRSSNLSLPTHY